MRLIGFSGEHMSQHGDELRKFVRILLEANVTRYLEIGARHGDTFHWVMSALPKGSLGVAVDLPNAQWGMAGSEDALIRCVNDLRRRRYKAHAIFADSHAPKTIAKVKRLGPYDACLIDADHRFDPAMQDYLDYSPMARIVALHDIDGHGVRSHKSGDLVEIPQVWRTVRRSAGVAKSKQVIGKRRGLGIGVMWMHDGEQRPSA